MAARRRGQSTDFATRARATPETALQIVRGEKGPFRAVGDRLGFFVGLELLLAGLGTQTALYDQDPYVGFSSYIPLFVPQTTADGPASMVTANNKTRWF